MDRKKAIVLARRVLEIDTQLHGAESEEVAGSIGVRKLQFFNDVGDDDEVLRLYEQAKEWKER